MSTYRIPALTAAEIRSIADKAVADVTRQKITTTRPGQTDVAKGMSPSERSAQNGALASQTVKNSQSNALQKSLSASVLSQSAGRRYFKEAFNKARKG